jgi:hypothetical protein
VGLLLSEPSPRLVSDTGDFLLAALMMIDMNGLDIQALDKVKELILESVNVEELQEEDAVKEQCRCNTTKQERTGQN